MDVVVLEQRLMARLRTDPAIRAKVKQTETWWPTPASPGAGGGQIREMLR